MEDQGITRTQGPTPYLRIYRSQQLSVPKKLENCLVIDCVQKPEKLQRGEIWLTLHTDHFAKIATPSREFIIPTRALSRWIQAWIATYPHRHSVTPKLNRSIRKLVSTVVDARLVNTVKHPALSTFLGREKARELEKSWRSPHMLPSIVLGLKDFSEYETCQLIVHERGRALVESWCLSIGGELEFLKTSAKNFTKIFNYVKKSKSKLFDQSVAMLEDVQVVGNFLAREFSFQNHSILLFLSRNGFLTPTTEELEAFNTLTGIITPYLDRLLAQEHSNERKGYLVKILDAIPVALELKAPNEVVSFANRAFKAIEDLGEKNRQVVALSQGWTLIVYEDCNNSFDLDHHRRVSLLGELLNTLQHELNNPLFGLNLSANVYSDETQGELSTSFHEIAINAARCQTIIRNFSKLYSTREEKKSVSLFNFIEEVFILTKSEIRGISRDILFEGFDQPRDFTIEVNPISLSQILFNLIINAGQAIKNYVGDDLAKIRTSSICVRVIKLEHSVRFQVEDTGPGLTDGFISNCLKPFYTTKQQGTGLGLTISRGLLESMGSRLEFDHNLPHGAVFFFELKTTPSVNG